MIVSSNNTNLLDWFGLQGIYRYTVYIYIYIHAYIYFTYIYTYILIVIKNTYIYVCLIIVGLTLHHLIRPNLQDGSLLIPSPNGSWYPWLASCSLASQPVAWWRYKVWKSWWLNNQGMLKNCNDGWNMLKQSRPCGGIPHQPGALIMWLLLVVAESELEVGMFLGVLMLPQGGSHKRHKHLVLRWCFSPARVVNLRVDTTDWLDALVQKWCVRWWRLVIAKDTDARFKTTTTTTTNVSKSSRGLSTSAG